MPIPVRQAFWRFLACALLAGAGAAAAETYTVSPGDDLVGELRWAPVYPNDALADVAHRNGVGFRQLIQANPDTDVWAPDPAKPVLLPTSLLLPRSPREGIVVNVTEMRLYYYPPRPRDGKRRVMVFPIAVGRADWKTPLGATRITAKVRDPVWHPPPSIRAEHAAEGDPLPAIVPPGPDNPLGTLALRLGWPQVLIHGTNKPLGIGMPVTHGCVRLYPEDIQTLFDNVPVGTRVAFIDEPYKLGRHEGRWYLEAHKPLAEDPAQTPDLAPALSLVRTGVRRELILNPDWFIVAQTLRRSTGIPVPIEMPATAAASLATRASR